MYCTSCGTERSSPTGPCAACGLDQVRKPSTNLRQMFFSTSGRISRSQYWATLAKLLAVFLITALPAGVAMENFPEGSAPNVDSDSLWWASCMGAFGFGSLSWSGAAMTEGARAGFFSGSSCPLPASGFCSRSAPWAARLGRTSMARTQPLRPRSSAWTLDRKLKKPSAAAS